MESSLDPYLAAHPDATPRLNAALVEAQKMLEPVKKEANNPFFKSKYADLANVLAAITPALNAHGIALTQIPDNDPTGVACITQLRHTSGEVLTGRFWLPVVKGDPQGYGSAFTYARRFGAKAIVGLAEEDDDGNSHAVDHPRAKTAKDHTKPTPSKPKPVDTTKLVEAFSGLGVPKAHLEDRIGRPLAEATDADVADLRAYFKRKKEMSQADPDEAARLEVQRQSEAALATAAAEQRKKIDAQMKQLDGPPPSVEVRRNAAFKVVSENIAEAKTAAMVTLVLANVPNEKLFGAGELKALQRAADNRIKILNDAQRVLPPPTEDLAF